MHLTNGVAGIISLTRRTTAARLSLSPIAAIKASALWSAKTVARTARPPSSGQPKKVGLPGWFSATHPAIYMIAGTLDRIDDHSSVAGGANDDDPHSLLVSILRLQQASIVRFGEEFWHYETVRSCREFVISDWWQRQLAGGRFQADTNRQHGGTMGKSNDADATPKRFDRVEFTLTRSNGPLIGLQPDFAPKLTIVQGGIVFASDRLSRQPRTGGLHPKSNVCKRFLLSRVSVADSCGLS